MISGFKVMKPKTITNKEIPPMKNILIAGLLVVSSAAFAGGRNANEPVNPPQPPVVVESAPGICAKFYNKVIPHYHASDIELAPLYRPLLAAPLKTVALVGADAFCVTMLVPVVVESLCHSARKAGYSCVSGADWTFTRPDVP